MYIYEGFIISIKKLRTQKKNTKKSEQFLFRAHRSVLSWRVKIWRQRKTRGIKVGLMYRFCSSACDNCIINVYLVQFICICLCFSCTFLTPCFSCRFLTPCFSCKFLTPCFSCIFKTEYLVGRLASPLTHGFPDPPHIVQMWHV